MSTAHPPMPMTTDRPGNAGFSLRGRVARLFGWFSEHPWVLLPLIALPAIWPLFSRGVLRTADWDLHLMRVIVLDHQLHQGTFYPRWVPELSTGLGHPLFSFYAPAAYYLVEVLHLLGLSFPLAFCTAFAVSVIASGFGMYLLARSVFGKDQRWPALVSAVAYMYAPYLLTNVYIRGALPEVCAQALLPWIFWSLRGLATADRPGNYVLPMALSLGALAVTHNITLLLAPLFLVLYALVLWWTGGRTRKRLLWITSGFVVAAGISAAFWIPLIVERGNVSAFAYEIAANAFVPENVWRWHNFLDTNFAFEHTFSIPFQLGLVQLILAFSGALLARRKDPEWLFFIAITLLAGLGISAWAKPLWLSSHTLLTVQFPWRLLGIMSVPLAVFTGGVVLCIRRQMIQVGASLAVVLLVVIANRPQVDWILVARFADIKELAIPTVAQFEFEANALGTSRIKEFMPRWSSGNIYDPIGERSIKLNTLRLEKAGRAGMELTIDSAEGGALRFLNLYYPGWRVILDGQQVLTPYPSTNMGLLTVDLSPGPQRVRLTWQGTPVQKVGELISLLALLGLTIFVATHTDRRWLAVIPACCVAVSLVITFWQPGMTEVIAPFEPVGTDDFSMLGYQLERSDELNLGIYPIWHVQKRPSAGTFIRWSLRDTAGQLVAWTGSRPYLNSFLARSWPPGTIVDDAYQLRLPSDLTPGTYELTAQIATPEGGDQSAPFVVGRVDLEAATPPGPTGPQPVNRYDASFGPDIRLAGYDVEINEVLALPSPLMVVKPGDQLNYVLYWQALQPLLKDYSASVHLMDPNRKHLAQQDHLAGGPSRPPTLWDSARLQPDRYSLEIPETAESGVYSPYVTMYDYQTGELLGEDVRLPSIKVLSDETERSPEHTLSAHFSDFATLIGYDLVLPEEQLRAGSQFTLTLYYQSDASAPQDYTRFVHLSNMQHGMAAQADSSPAEGRNPTSAWMPGEIIVDKVGLTVAEDVVPGTYSLQVGLYDPANGVRVPVGDKAGKHQPDGQVTLTDVPIEE